MMELSMINDFRRAHVRNVVKLVVKYKSTDAELVRQVCSIVDLENEMIEYEVERHNRIFGATKGDPDYWEPDDKNR